MQHYNFARYISMRSQPKLFALLFFLTVADPLSGLFAMEAAPDAVALADPMVGTAIGRGTEYPGAALPFSLVKLSPDTTKPWTAGYNPDEPIVGFSHTHISGTSSTAFAGQILVRPQTGPLDVMLTGSPKKDEFARPGFYSVTLTRDRVKAELTLTERAGIHRYTFPADGPGRILIEASATLNNSKTSVPSSVCTGSEARFVSDREIEGQAGFIGGYTKFAYKIYFVACFDQNPSAKGAWLDAKPRPGAINIIGGRSQHAGLYAEFSNFGLKPIGLRVGISYTSIANARRNLAASDGLTFEQVKARAQNIWRDHFNRIIVEGGTDSQRRQFYTAMYHSVLAPTDATGDQGPWPTNEPAYWDIYTIWDVFRCAYPLNTLLHPDRQSDIVRSLIDVYKQTGWLRDGWAYQKVGFTLQGGTDVDNVIADAVAKHLGGFDLNLAYEAVKKNATVPAPSKIYTLAGRQEPYFRLGYVPAKFALNKPSDPEKNEYEHATSGTLEYAYNDFCVATVAAAAGHPEEAAFYRHRSLNAFLLFNPANKFFTGKTAEGEWLPDFDLTFNSGGSYAIYYEGSAWHYRFTVPHDQQGLINRLGGKGAYVAILDEYFDGHHHTHDNEPTFLTEWLYDYAGRPDKTVDRVRHTLAADYHLAPAGYAGDEDNGAMSSWYVFGAMGFYPNAGQDIYLLASPIFSKVTLKLGDSGKTFVISAPGVSETNRYVQSATLNGKPSDDAWLRHSDIINGAELVLTMGPKPSGWGTKTPPPSLSSPDSP